MAGAESSICVKCGLAQDPENRKCSNCGSKEVLPESQVVECDECQRMNVATARKCRHCNAEFEDDALRSRKKNRMIASLFAFFLGFLGIHRFYLGQPALGFTRLGLYLIIGLPLFMPDIFSYGLAVILIGAANFFWHFVDFVLIISGSTPGTEWK